MKRLIAWLLAGMLLFCLGGCADSEAESSLPQANASQPDPTAPLAERLARELDDAYARDAKKAEYSTTVGMVNLANKYTQKWQQIADDYYTKISEYKATNDQKTKNLQSAVAAMKNSWEQYNQKQCQLYLKALQTVYGDGSVGRPLFATYKLSLQKEWALQLVGLYQQLNVK